MPKQKQMPKDQPVADVSPPLNREHEEIVRIFTQVAEFYEFFPVRTPLFEPTKFLSSISRAGLLQERRPVLCKFPPGDYYLRVSGALSLLRAGLLGTMGDEIKSVPKFLHIGESFSLSAPNGTETAESKSPSSESWIFSEIEWTLLMLEEQKHVAEAEMIHVLWKALGETVRSMDNWELHLNAIGCDHCRPSFRSSLLSYLRQKANRLCRISRKDLKRQPTKILLCENEECRIIASRSPQILDFLCESCKKHLRGLLEFLDENRIPYFLNPRMFREGSWFSDTVFELIKNTPPAGGNFAQNSEKTGEEKARDTLPSVAKQDSKTKVAEGGCLTKAAKAVSAKDTAAVSFTMFPAVFASLLCRENQEGASGKDIFLIQLGELAKRKSFEIMDILRKHGLPTAGLFGRDSIKSQMKAAEQSGARISLILGQKEAITRTIIVREMHSDMQETIPQEKLTDFLKRKLARKQTPNHNDENP
jgi:histidyl-tRNA synthetase